MNQNVIAKHDDHMTESTSFNGPGVGPSRGTEVGAPLKLLQQLEAILMDTDSMMQERARAGYATDSSKNVDVLQEELDMLYKHLQDLAFTLQAFSKRNGRFLNYFKTYFSSITR